MREHFFNAAGVQLNYVEGPDNGPALLLLPGQSTTWQSYAPVFPALTKNFHVFALSIRGHGKSTWTPGRYDFKTIGNDLVLFLQEVVKTPAIISGNSSGGLLGLWLSANHPHLVRGLVLEDPPLFSADWPRIKNEFVYEILTKTSAYLGKESGADYVGFFKSIQRPLPDGRVKKLPAWLCSVLAWLILQQERRIAEFILALLPRTLRLLVNVLPTFDPDFSRAWVDGRIYAGLNHEEALRKLQVPALLMHADWFRSSKGLVGAMDDNDVQHARQLAPHMHYRRIFTQHVIHSASPEEFVNALNQFVNETVIQKEKTS
jgi:pimeloyl-ACP methyl ester carboxylesterase